MDRLVTARHQTKTQHTIHYGWSYDHFSDDVTNDETKFLGNIWKKGYYDKKNFKLNKHWETEYVTEWNERKRTASKYVIIIIRKSKAHIFQGLRKGKTAG